MPRHFADKRMPPPVIIPTRPSSSRGPDSRQATPYDDDLIDRIDKDLEKSEPPRKRQRCERPSHTHHRTMPRQLPSAAQNLILAPGSAHAQQQQHTDREQVVEDQQQPNNISIPTSQLQDIRAPVEDSAIAGPTNLSERARGKQPVRAPPQQSVVLNIRTSDRVQSYHGIHTAAQLVKIRELQRRFITRSNDKRIPIRIELPYDLQTVENAICFAMSDPDAIFHAWAPGEQPKHQALLKLYALGHYWDVEGLREAVCANFRANQNLIDANLSWEIAHAAFARNDHGHLIYDMAEGSQLETLVRELLYPHLDELIISGALFIEQEQRLLALYRRVYRFRLEQRQQQN